MIEDMIDRAAAAARRADGGYAFGVWPARARELALIRMELRRWLVSLGVGGTVQENMVLAACEATTNSVEHAYADATEADTVELMFWTESDAVCVEIVDHGRWQAPSTELDGRGRGILLMRRLMESVLIEHGPGGTTVLLRSRMQGVPPGGRQAT